MPGTTRQVHILYRDYSDDGRHFVDGVESATYTPGLFGPATYDADVSLHGCRQGFLAANGAQIAPAAITGTVESEVDGNLRQLP